MKLVDILQMDTDEYATASFSSSSSGVVYAAAAAIVPRAAVADMAIRVVVRKRPISKGELSRGDYDVLEIHPGGNIYVHEPKTKV